MKEILPELGYYTLPGHVFDPGQVDEDVRGGDALGFGSVWISERHNTKNGSVLAGYAAARTDRMGIAAGLMNQVTLRNPLVVAGSVATMAKLTGDRYALGIGRGVDGLADASGTPRINFKVLEEYISVLRRLWNGERVDHDGVIGRFTGLSLSAELNRRPPIIMAAMGDKTCLWAGRHCDGVLLNSLWSAEAVRKSVALVRQGAEEAGRDPKSVRVWTIVLTACDTPEEVYLKEIIRRMNTYIIVPQMFEQICRANGWDLANTVRVREMLAQIDGERYEGTVGDENTTRDLDVIRRMEALYPRQWIDEGCAVGSRDACAQRIRDRFDAGADGVLIHASVPRYLGSLIEAWPRFRPAGAARLPVNPGYAA